MTFDFWRSLREGYGLCRAQEIDWEFKLSLSDFERANVWCDKTSKDIMQKGGILGGYFSPQQNKIVIAFAHIDENVVPWIMHATLHELIHWADITIPHEDVYYIGDKLAEGVE